jgi:hypothetical protein
VQIGGCWLHGRMKHHLKHLERGIVANQLFFNGFSEWETISTKGRIVSVFRETLKQSSEREVSTVPSL